MNSIIKKYCRAIKRALPCSRGMKAKITEQIAESVEQFLATNPNATYADVEAAFGTPLQIATAYLEEADSVKLSHELKLKNRIVRIFSVVMLIALLLFAVTLAIVIHADYSSDNGYITTEFGNTSIIED